jgi:DNA repair protein SbcC/Rad50
MKPLRLTIQAFGPYPGREVVDFRDAISSGLFGIYGKTGSGKSSVFSAMTFALFGKPANAEQEPTTLRSDHAEAATTTEVEFVFDLADRRYVILRQPDQMRPKKIGSGETRLPHEAYFFDATAMQLEDIKADNRGKMIAEKKVGVVDEAICGVLGYKSEQFRQIVLLPQGKFETFLTSKTKDRVSILRELFDVSLYRRVTEKLKAEADAAENAIKQEREFCTRQLKDEGFESTDALTSGIQECNTQVATLADAELAANRVWDKAQRQLAAARDLEAKFSNSETANNRLMELNSKGEEMAALEKRVAKAAKAQSLKDVEDAAIRAAWDLAEARKKMDAARIKAETAKQTAQQSAEALTNEEGHSGELQALNEQVFTLTSHKETIKTAAGLRVALEGAQATEKSTLGNLNSAQKILFDIQDKQRTKKAQWENAVKDSGSRKDLMAKLSELNNSLKIAQAFENAQKGIVEAKLDVANLQSDFEVHSGAERVASQTFEEAERNLSAVQALHLAHKLTDGEPCPVCGSTIHPSPATGKIENEGLDLAFRSAKSAIDAAKAKTAAAAQKLTKAQGALTERESQFSSLEKPEKPTTEIRTLVTATQRAHDTIVVIVDPLVAQNEYDDLILKLETENRNLAETQTALAEAKQETSAASAQYQQAISGVPEYLRVVGALEVALGKAQAELNQRQNALIAAQKADGEAKLAAVGARAEAEGAAGAVNGYLQRNEESKKSFHDRLAEIGMTEPDYQALKPAIASVVVDQKKVGDYKFELKIAQDAATNTSSQTNGLTRPDVVAGIAQLAAADAGHKQAMEHSIRAKERLKRLNDLLSKLRDTLQRLDEEEAKSGPLRNLAALCSGTNPLRLDLETFAIGAMFDQALEAANLRLMPMTSNRYRLERDVEGSGNGRRGLGIQAFDAYTGKSRPTSTLSGGETFIFALALALGLADVVESTSGKIRLDTVFIDEGFGSLDTENDSGTLDQVLHALGSLVKKSRAVGLISHVPHVQEAIPNGFYIRKNTTGSSIETRGAM